MKRTALAMFTASLLSGCPGDDSPPELPPGDSSSSGGECDVFNPCATDTSAEDTAGTTVEVPDLTTDEDGDDGANTTGVTGDECQVSADCDGGLFCVAPFDPELGVFGMGDFECVAECVVEMDELRWCADDAACCDSNLVCTDRGYCEPPGVEDDTGGDESTGGSTDDDAGDESTGGSTG